MNSCAVCRKALSMCSGVGASALALFKQLIKPSKWYSVMVVVKNIAPLNIKTIYISWASGNCYRNCINVATLFLYSQCAREHRLIFVS